MLDQIAVNRDENFKPALHQVQQIAIGFLRPTGLLNRLCLMAGQSLRQPAGEAFVNKNSQSGRCLHQLFLGLLKELADLVARAALNLFAFGQDKVSRKGAQPGEKVCAGPVLRETLVGFDEADMCDLVRLDTGWTKSGKPGPQASVISRNHRLVILQAAGLDSEDGLIDIGIVHGSFGRAERRRPYS